MIFSSFGTELFEGELVSSAAATTDFHEGIVNFRKEYLNRFPDTTIMTNPQAITNLFAWNSSSVLKPTMYKSQSGAIAVYDVDPTGNSTTSVYSVNLGGTQTNFGKNRVPTLAFGFAVTGYNPTLRRWDIWYDEDVTYILAEYVFLSTVQLDVFFQIFPNRIIISYNNRLGSSLMSFHISSYGTNRIVESTASHSIGSTTGIIDITINSEHGTSLTLVSSAIDLQHEAEVYVHREFPLLESTEETLLYSFDGGPNTTDPTTHGAEEVVITSTLDMSEAVQAVSTYQVWGVAEGREGTGIALRLGTVGIRNAVGDVTIKYSGDVGTLYGDGGFLPTATWTFTPQDLQPKFIPDIIAGFTGTAGTTLSSTPITDTSHTNLPENVSVDSNVTTAITFVNTGGSDV